MNGCLQSYKLMKVTSGDNMECAIRVLEYIPGKIAQKLPLYHHFFYEIGVNCAQMHCLMDQARVLKNVLKFCVIFLKFI